MTESNAPEEYLMASKAVTKIPSLVYGTAWKKDATADLVRQALLAGFRGVDTAAQPKHYREDLVGAGIRAAMREAPLERRHLHIQTKFTAIHGQDPTNMPYDASAPIPEQVSASVRSSLHHLRPSDAPESDDEASYIDCLVLHSPFPDTQDTARAWAAMEALVPHPVRALGVSNIYHLPSLQRLYDAAVIKPAVVQNRFYADTAYDAEIRAFCRERGVVYQSFWTLTANPQLLRSDTVSSLAAEVGVSKPVALYGLVLGLGRDMSVLDGTTKADRMGEDLEGLSKCNEWRERNPTQWKEKQKAFERLLLQ